MTENERCNINRDLCIKHKVFLTGASRNLIMDLFYMSAAYVIIHAEYSHIYNKQCSTRQQLRLQYVVHHFVSPQKM